MRPDPPPLTRGVTPSRTDGVAERGLVVVTALVTGGLAALLTESSLVRQVLVGVAVTALVLVVATGFSLAVRRRLREVEARDAALLRLVTGMADGRLADALAAAVEDVLPHGTVVGLYDEVPGPAADQLHRVLVDDAYATGRASVMPTGTTGREADRLCCLPVAVGPERRLAVVLRIPEAGTDVSRAVELLRRVGPLLAAAGATVAGDSSAVAASRDAAATGDAAVAAGLRASIARDAHDLRTPLNTLAGMIDTLIRHGEGLPAAQRRELLEATQRSTRRIASWITMLLDTATDRAPSPPTDVATPLRPLLDEAAMISSAATTGLDVQVEPTILHVAADSSAVVRVVSNLLANAGHHANATKVIVGAQRAGGFVQIRVSDDGDGWATPDRGGHDAGERHQHAGHGLGLVSVRSQVAAWGGELELDDTPGGGATVRFTLPRGDDAASGGGTGWTIAGNRSVVRGVEPGPTPDVSREQAER